MASSYRRIIILLSVLILGSACKTEDPYYCEGARLGNCSFKGTCTETSHCSVPTPNTPVCDLSEGGSIGNCVQCTTTDHEECRDITPVCGDNNMCQRCNTQRDCDSSLACFTDGSCGNCTKHVDCDSSLACLPDGTCADPGQVAYVQSGSMGPPPCKQGEPCGKLQQGIDSVNETSIRYIKVSSLGGEVLNSDATTMIDGKAVIILADPGVKLALTTNGINLEVRNTGADVQIYDLEITGASGSVGISISGMPKLALTRVRVTNMGAGISAVGGIVTVSQSTISGNSGQGISMAGGMLVVSQSTILNNAQGGISVTGTGITFNIKNCFIFRNGNDVSADIGGARFSGALGASSVFAFNTVVDNRIRNTDFSAGGVYCDLPGFVASNNLIVRNFRNNASTPMNSNTLGQCTHATSTVAQTVSGLNFMSSDATPYNYHLQLGSSAIDQATTPLIPEIGIDFDGDLRPMGSASDQGADEVR